MNKYSNVNLSNVGRPERILLTTSNFTVNCYFVSSSFKLFLELEPQLRDVLYKFHESQYAACLKLLDEMKVQNVHVAVLIDFVSTLYLLLEIMRVVVIYGVVKVKSKSLILILRSFLMSSCYECKILTFNLKQNLKNLSTSSVKKYLHF